MQRQLYNNEKNLSIADFDKRNYLPHPIFWFFD
jgi:hypothetical protein